MGRIQTVDLFRPLTATGPPGLIWQSTRVSLTNAANNKLIFNNISEAGFLLIVS